MKTVVIILFFSFLFSLSALAASETAPMARQLPKSGSSKRELEKSPKSLFLIKKIKINPEVGEPQFNVEQAQLRTVIDDPVLHNTRKFE